MQGFTEELIKNKEKIKYVIVLNEYTL